MSARKSTARPSRSALWPHWAPELQAPVAFPYSLPTEASTLGGGVWQDNSDGTYTRLRDGYFCAATGYSYLDLYLMGLISGSDVAGLLPAEGARPSRHGWKRASGVQSERTRITIRDVIAGAGPRSPDVDKSQREFNTGIVVAVEHGRSPRRELLRRGDGIRRQWLRYWDTVTGHRAPMTAKSTLSTTRSGSQQNARGGRSPRSRVVRRPEMFHMSGKSAIPPT